MNKLNSETLKYWYDKYTMTYLLLIRKAAMKKAEARKRILANEDDIDEAMKKYRRYDRIIYYLLDRINRERKSREFGSA